ncbi:hypothetical protein EW146_g5702 [Bondarzewia mesenterica]|uniref:Uncharacterized protein n=1 Tax=Bondarzewia mesenterica TaxID=1095465 RepID=A0A4S4LRP2_9AGAM|nr:hypothetical protein EW146_g5702 [Bondarzewia mesenterica]
MEPQNCKIMSNMYQDLQHLMWASSDTALLFMTRAEAKNVKEKDAEDGEEEDEAREEVNNKNEDEDEDEDKNSNQSENVGEKDTEEIKEIKIQCLTWLRVTEA